MQTLLGVVLALNTTLACAQAQPYVGASVGDTDFGTGAKVFGGAAITNIIGWEAQLASFGTKRLNPGSNLSCSNSAWATGGSATGKLPLADQISAFGKAGLHYLRVRESGACSGVSDSSIELGIGIGMLWRFSPKASLRVEFENIGGSGGDIVSVGIQIPL